MKIEQMLGKMSAQISDKNCVWGWLFLPIFQPLYVLMVKKCLYFRNGLIHSGLWYFCDTCDSENAKTPVRRARTRAREDVFLEKFALSKSKIEREGKMIELRSATSGKIFLLRCRIL